MVFDMQEIHWEKMPIRENQEEAWTRTGKAVQAQCRSDPHEEGRKAG